MKRSWPIFILVLLFALLASSSAWAHGHGGGFHGGHWGGGHAHSHGHVGVVIGGAWGVPWSYPPYYYPAYVYPPVVAAPASPPVYIEQGSSQQGEPSTDSWWYYCKSPPGYYPYVPQCPQGWQLVDPRPPDLK